ncbi:ABC transporter permease [Streptomyces sp. NPDC001843]|uniref:ABC transporter permease n=1 Tax=Streptomyces sp. NPDC001843 TaxID=3364617 RepID=UPI0036A5D281
MTAGGEVPRVAPPASGGRGPARRGVPALARVESVRLLRHPAMLGGLGACLLLWGHALVTGDAANRYPVLQDSSRQVQLPLLLIAAGTLLAANLGALRSRRHGVEPVYAVTGLGIRARTLAHLLAVLPAVVLSALLVCARLGYLAAKPGAVGTIQWAEVATGPAVVLLAGVLGVLTAASSTSPAAASLVVAVLAVFTFVAAVQNTADWRWLAVIAGEDEFAQPLPSALIGRPAGRHLLWLTGLSTVFACAALLRGRTDEVPEGPRRGTGALWMCTAAATVLAVLSGVLQTRALPDSVVRARAAATDRPARQQKCEKQGNVTYCAFPEFTGRVKQWNGVVRGILARTPDGIATAPYAVRQRILRAGAEAQDGGPLPSAAWEADDRRAGTPAAVPVGTWWSAGSAGQDAESDAVAEFSAMFSYRVVSGSVPKAPRVNTVCGSRAVLTLWLAAQASGETAAALRDLEARSTSGLTLLVLNSATGLGFEHRETRFAQDLLAQPADRIGARVKASWQELTAPGTSTDRAAQLLGVRAPARVPADESPCR